MSHVPEPESVAFAESKPVTEPVSITEPVAITESVAITEPESLASATGGAAGLRAGATVQLRAKLPHV